MKIRIAVVDDHKIFRKSLIRLIDDCEDFLVVLETSNGIELLEKISIARTEVDILLLDLQMPEMDGFQCLQILENDYPEIKTIVLSQLSAEHYLKKAIYLGVSGYFTKDSEPFELLEAIRKIHHGGFYFEGKLKHLVDGIIKEKRSYWQNSPTSFDFTKRELEIIYWSLMELKSKDIANKLEISYRTVEGHKSGLIKKTGAKSFLGVILIALEFNLLTKNPFS